MANIRTCNKHNMIACVEKTAHNADFYQIIDYLTGCSINYSLLVDPDLIGPWLQQFWATASLRVINEVPHIRATVAGKKVLISEETIRADLLQKPWWQQTTMKILTGPKNLMLNQITPLTPPMLEVVTALAAEEAHSTSPHSRATSSPRDAQGSPDQSAAQASISQGTAKVQGTDNSQGTAKVQGTDNSQGTAEVQGTADFQGTAETHGVANIPKSPNDYTPTDAS
ncbi:hypothetical protein Tco_0870220, partial [Tanacetum coccineum]